VIALITSRFGQGAIGYVENPYTLNSYYPVLALGNAAVGYALPALANVTTALTWTDPPDRPGASALLPMATARQSRDTRYPPNARLPVPDRSLLAPR
jgi:hypothetical protein